jgi:signal transduction histidine kinase/DNA-binding response OmpR family regulator
MHCCAPWRAEEEKPAVSDSTTAAERVRILMVEDTPEHQDLMLMTLAKSRPDWQVEAFWSAEHGLEAARRRAYDAAVLDFTLPGMNGLDLAEQLHALVADMPIVLVTARGSEKVAARALRAGVSEYLIKEGDYLDLLPLAIAKAMETVAAARERERMRRELQRRTEELQAINDVSAAVASTLSLNEVLAEALGRVLSVINASAGVIYVVDVARRRATLEVCQGVDERTLSLMRRWRPNRTGVRRLMEGRRSLVSLAEVFRITSPSEPIGDDLAPIESYLAIPLKANAVLMGLLCARPRSGQGFAAADLRLLTALTQPISVAMANARLYQQTTEQLAALQASQERLVAAAQAMAAQRLAQGMAGEINNAMTSIKGSAQLILRERGLPHEVQTDAARILEGCDRVLRLTSTLATMTVQPEGRRAPHSINRIVNNCIEQLKSSTEALHIAVMTSLAPHLPTVSIEGEALEQALLNIMINAVEAMPRGGQLRINTGQEDDSIFIAVTDTGEGIPPENLERIFDPDFTTRSDRGRARGLGLGLFASRNLIQARGGTISVRSEVGKGSCFTIRLPANRPSEAQGQADGMTWGEASEEELIREAGLVLNTRTRQVAVGPGRVEGLTKMEARLLEVFMTNPNVVLKRDFLMREVWETDYVGDTRTLDVHVHWLREKIEENPSRPRLLRTVRGLGYRFGRSAGPRDEIDLGVDLEGMLGE